MDEIVTLSWAILLVVASILFYVSRRRDKYCYKIALYRAAEREGRNRAKVEMLQNQIDRRKK